MLPDCRQTRGVSARHNHVPSEKGTSYTTDLELSWEAQCQIGEFCLSSLDSLEQNQELFVPARQTLNVEHDSNKPDKDNFWNQASVLPRMSLVLDPTCCSHYLGIQDPVQCFKKRFKTTFNLD